MGQLINADSWVPPPPAVVVDVVDVVDVVIVVVSRSSVISCCRRSVTEKKTAETRNGKEKCARSECRVKSPWRATRETRIKPGEIFTTPGPFWSNRQRPGQQRR